MMNAEQIRAERERVLKLLEGTTEGEWYAYRHFTGTSIYSPRTPRPNEHFEPDEHPIHVIAENAGSADGALMAESQRLAHAYLAALDTIAALHAQLAQVRALGAKLKAGELETERLKAEIDHAWEALEAHRDSTGHLFTTPVTEPLHLAALEAEAAISRHYAYLRVIRREIRAVVKALTPQEAQP